MEPAAEKLGEALGSEPLCRLAGSGEQKLACRKSGTAARDSIVCLGRCILTRLTFELRCSPDAKLDPS